MENTQPTNNKIFVYLLALFFAVFIGSGIFLLVSNKQVPENQGTSTSSTLQQEKMVIPTAMPTSGSLKLALATEEATLNKEVDFNILANSAGENISAYDVIISFDPLAFDFIQATSLDPAFQVYSYKKDSRLSLTVVKTSQDLTPSVFTDKEVINLTFNAKKIGQYTFEILSSFDKESTKFVNEKTEVVNPEVNQVNLNVQ